MPERLRFEREIEDLGLRQYEQPQPPGSAIEVVVGERVVLDLNNHGFAGFKIESVRWEVPAYAVRSYKEDKNSAKLTRLSASDLTKNPLVFHWVKPGDGEKVRVVATGSRGTVKLDKDISITFDVKGPKLDHFRATTSKPLLVQKGKKLRISFGDNTDKAGVAWDWQVTIPDKYPGLLKDVQTVKMGRMKTQLLRPDRRARRTLVKMLPGAAKAEQLDLGVGEDACLDEHAVAKYSFQSKVKAGEVYLNSFSFDTPSDELKPLDLTYSVDESFKYYILYKPEKPDAIWVPVGKADWYWKADVIRSGSKWNFKKGGKREGGVVGGKGVPTTEFPEYPSNTCLNQWCELKADKSIDCAGASP